jgi:hypothetical protein
LPPDRTTFTVARVDTAGASSSRTSRRWEAYTPWAGIAFVGLFLAGFLIGGDPGTKDGAKIADHFADQRTTILVGMYLAGLALLAFFVWVWSLRSILLRTGEEALATAVLIAGALMIAVEFPVIALETGLAFISNQPIDPGLARALYDLAQVFSYVDWFPTALLFAALALAVRRTRLVASWLGWTAAAISVLALVAAPPALGLDLPVSLISFLWIVVLSVILGAAGSKSANARA